MTGRLDGPLKVTGRAQYGVDHNFPGMAYGYVVLSTIAHGEIAAMDVTAANPSCPGENCGPAMVVVNAGSTRLSVASVATVAMAAPAPSALNDTT